MNRGAYNQISALGPSFARRKRLRPRQTGDPHRLHFADQLTLCGTWQCNPMHIADRDITNHAIIVKSVTVTI